LKVEVLHPSTSFFASSGGNISRREALIITYPVKAILDPIVFWEKAKKGPVMYSSPIGIAVTANPNQTVTVSMNDNVKAVKVAVGKTWKDVVAIPFPLMVGIKLKSNGKTISVPTKFYMKNGTSKGRNYVRVPLSRRIRPDKGTLIIPMTRRKAHTPRKRATKQVIIIKKKSKR